MKRLKKTSYIRLGGNVFWALRKNHQSRRRQSVLEWLRTNRGIAYLDFFGSILTLPDGDRFIPSLYWSGKGWKWTFLGLRGSFANDDPAALLPE